MTGGDQPLFNYATFRPNGKRFIESSIFLQILLIECLVMKVLLCHMAGTSAVLVIALAVNMMCALGADCASAHHSPPVRTSEISSTGIPASTAAHQLSEHCASQHSWHRRPSLFGVLSGHPSCLREHLEHARCSISRSNLRRARLIFPHSR